MKNKTLQIQIASPCSDDLPAASYWLRITRGTELVCTKLLVKQ